MFRQDKAIEQEKKITRAGKSVRDTLAIVRRVTNTPG